MAGLEVVELGREDDGVGIPVGVEQADRPDVVASAVLSSESTGVIPLPALKATTIARHR